MHRRSFILSTLALAAFPAAGQFKSELRLSTATGPAFALGKAGERWAALLAEKSGGSLDPKHFPGATLAGRDPLRELGALCDGAIDMAVGSALAWSSQLPAFGVYGLPWLAPEPREQEALAAAPGVRAALDAAAAAAGITVIAVAPLGERVIATMDAGVTTPADLAGVKVRAMTIPLVTETLATLGARPESMPLADAQAAFAARTLGGQEGPPSTLAAVRIAASGLRFVTRWGAFADMMVFAVRSPAWSAWNPELRATARASALEAAREASAPAREDAALAELSKQGVTIVRPTAAQRAALRASSEAVWTKWSGTIGADLVAAAQAAVKAS